MAQIQCSLILKKKKIGRPDHSLILQPLRPITSHICLTPIPSQSGRHMCITPNETIRPPCNQIIRFF